MSMISSVQSRYHEGSPSEELIQFCLHPSSLNLVSEMRLRFV